MITQQGQQAKMAEPHSLQLEPFKPGIIEGKNIAEKNEEVKRAEVKLPSRIRLLESRGNIVFVNTKDETSPKSSTHSGEWEVPSGNVGDMFSGEVLESGTQEFE
eukprot:TRINITY_DN2445_c0_g3_i1.p4 TRINITY_DN2445_c0_g3~~TRINITY_DN2445_c0_g3_i1.p4  ORF type:complete len:104 (+),score=28.89 TRINITY_DN2445_c0_g3_i1:89-400(+)